VFFDARLRQHLANRPVDRTLVPAIDDRLGSRVIAVSGDPDSHAMMVASLATA